jgi:hypothetical protein
MASALALFELNTRSAPVRNLPPFIPRRPDAEEP